VAAVRLRGRRDSNHAAIRKGLRDRGIRVIDLGAVGGGCPDLLAGTPRGNTLLEIKAPGGDLTPAQVAFFATWPGPKAVVETLEQALAAVGR